jgi:glycosyltransferase involved in cell wall biosynthesis
MDGIDGIDGIDGTRLWVVCPCYKDVASFVILRERISEVIGGVQALRSLELHFAVVDDTAGYDHEIGKLKELSNVRVITPPFNLGHQRALVYGLRLILPDVCESDLVVTMDADGEDRPEDLPRLIESLMASPDEHGTLCVARRTKRTESIKFRVLYLAFRTVFHTLTGTTVRSGNFAAYRGWLARRILTHPYFDLCYSSTLVSLDVPVTPIPCPRGKRYAGRSRMNMLRLFMHGVRMLMPFTDRIAVRALIAFSATFGLGFLLSLVVVGIRLFTTAAIPGWATATLLGLLILSFIALGNFVVLFAVFSHSRGISLASLEQWGESRPGETPAAQD